MGSLKNRCFTESTGIVMDEDYLCGKKECPKINEKDKCSELFKKT